MHPMVTPNRAAPFCIPCCRDIATLHKWGTLMSVILQLLCPFSIQEVKEWFALLSPSAATSATSVRTTCYSLSVPCENATGTSPPRIFPAPSSGPANAGHNITIRSAQKLQAQLIATQHCDLLVIIRGHKRDGKPLAAQGAFVANCPPNSSEVATIGSQI